MEFALWYQGQPAELLSSNHNDMLQSPSSHTAATGQEQRINQPMSIDAFQVCCQEDMLPRASPTHDSDPLTKHKASDISVGL